MAGNELLRDRINKQGIIRTIKRRSFWTKARR